MSDVDLSSKARMKLSGLVNQGTREVSNLLRREIELARRELGDSAKQAAKGAGFAGGAAGAGALGVVFGSIAVWQVLAKRMGSVNAAALVAGGYAGAAVLLASRARTELERVHGAPRTIATLEELTPGGD
ncbi:MAG TPA: phage holin family protein [Amnibacterium sp.]|jgi:hypothetical protein|uniref:phage holin family protein n=1 Tax=Amnibacterium sp. TaxID=1872496 RepID=UPI002F9532FE